MCLSQIASILFVLKEIIFLPEFKSRISTFKSNAPEKMNRVVQFGIAKWQIGHTILAAHYAAYYSRVDVLQLVLIESMSH